MWAAVKNSGGRGFMTPPPPQRKSRAVVNSPIMPMSERKSDAFHAVHKVPSGDSPYVKAKRVQLIEKDPSKAIALFWAAINAGDRVDSALKDMAIVMKQLDRSDEAIEAIKSFRHLCPYDSQESIDNVLIELYKRSGRIKEEIEMLQRKLKRIEEGVAFNGKRTKTARSQGKKVQVTIDQERSRVLGNLAWAYMQLKDYETAEELYRKALSLEPDNNKQCNLAICLMHMNRIAEAESLLLSVIAYARTRRLDESCAKSFERALQLLFEFEPESVLNPAVHGNNAIMINGEFFSSDNVRNSKAHKKPIHVGQGNVSGMVSGKLPNRLDEDLNLLNDFNRGSYCQDRITNIETGVPYDEGNLKYTSCGPKSQQSSPGRGSYSETPKSDLLSKIRETCLRNQSPIYIVDTEGGSGHRKTNAAPFNRRNAKVPFTEPTRRSRETRKGYEKRHIATEDTLRNPSRKLCFEQSTTSENLQAPIRKLYKERSQALDMDRSIVSLKNSETSLVSPSHILCRGSSLGDYGKFNPPVVKPYSQALANGNLNGSWKENGYAAEQNEAEQLIKSKHAMQSSGSQTTLPFCKADGGRDLRSNEISSGGVGSTNPVEELWSVQSQMGQSDSFGNPQQNKSNKSWADLVEEEEQELSMASGCSWSFLDDFNDENIDSNIVSEADHPFNQLECLSQRLESFELVEGQNSPLTAVSSGKSKVRQSINFDQQQKGSSVADSACLSSCPRSPLNAEKSCFLPDSKTNFLSEEYAQPKRKNRLQVFRDITPHPESPSA